MEVEAFTPRFSAVAQELAAAARALGLVAPAFSSPPARQGIDRAIRWWPGRRGGTIVVRRRERPFGAVVADMVEGVIVVNRLVGADAERVRLALHDAAAAAVPGAGRAA